MAPDADAGKAGGNRSDPFAPLTSQLLPVGDSHEIYVETVGRVDGVPAVYLHGGPGSGCQPDHRRLFDPERFHAVLFDQRGAGRSRPKGHREHNTLPHLIADIEIIREKFGFERWMIVGGSWGATLALAYAQAHPNRVTGIVLRATFLGTRAELEGAFLDVLPRFYPDLSDDFLKLLPPEERAQPLDAYWRRILDADPAVHAPAGRAWGDTERILSEHVSGRVQLDLNSPKSTRAMPATPFMEAHYFQNNCFMRPGQLMAEAGRLSGISGIMVQGRYDLLCPPATSRALSALWPQSEVRVVEGAGHSLYDPGVRDAVMKAIADLASKITAQGVPQKMPFAGKGMLLTSMDIDPSDEAEFNRWYDREHLLERVAIDGFLEARRYIAHAGSPKYLCLYSTGTFDVLDSPAYRTALTNPTDWSKATLARFKNMIRAVARITVSRGTGRGAALGIVRLRPRGDGKDALRTALRERLDPEKLDGIISMHLIESDPALSRPITDDPPVSDPGAGDWFVLIDGTDVSAISTAITDRLGDVSVSRAAETISTGVYNLMWDLAKSDIQSS
jgi:proline iminopeptidase